VISATYNAKSGVNSAAMFLAQSAKSARRPFGEAAANRNNRGPAAIHAVTPTAKTFAQFARRQPAASFVSRAEIQTMRRNVANSPRARAA